ncbi:Exopolygalacturonase clone GBGE184 [Zea mays]|uniref:Exopolygalacturonase clone GBGE184 n=1 Tax=Zea mays TaxID=4577 RepID=A0A1D6NIB3_MAIZE|nr:Exopolygalacturonase clone GBGE184 [Zea mays]
MAPFFDAYYSSLVPLLFSCVLSSGAGAAEAAAAAAYKYNVAGFGARPDGRTDSAGAFASAWPAACRSQEPATVLHQPWRQQQPAGTTAPGSCSTASTASLCGAAPSTAAARRCGLWACKQAAEHGGCPSGATSLKVLNSRDVVISGLTSVESELYHVVVEGCEGVTVQDVQIVAPGSSPNTDGIHVQASSQVTVTRTSIRTGDDDCVSVGTGTTNLRVEHGWSLGKEREESGVENVTVTGAAFVATDNGLRLRIKTWARARVDGAYVRGVVFEHALMHDVRNPIIID